MIDLTKEAISNNLSGRKGAGLADAFWQAESPSQSDLATLERHQEARPKRPESRRSGGPRTEQGRAASSQNALRHGAYARPQGELALELELAKQAAVQEFAPVGAFQQGLVEGIAHTQWREQMLARYERARLEAVQAQDVGAQELAHALGFPWAKSHLLMLSHPPGELELKRRIEGFWLSLAAQFDLVRGSQSCDPQDNLAAQLYPQVIAKFGAPTLLQHNEEDFLARMDEVMDAASNGANFVGRRVVALGDETPLVDYWLYRNLRAIAAKRQEILATRCQGVLSDEGVARARAQNQSAMRRQLQSYQLLRSEQALSVSGSWPSGAPRRALKERR